MKPIHSAVACLWLLLAGCDRSGDPTVKAAPPTPAPAPAVLGVVRGRVVAGGQPVAGALVSAYPITKDALTEESRSEQTVTATTDAAGEFLLTGVVVGPLHFFSVTAPGYCDAGKGRQPAAAAPAPPPGAGPSGAYAVTLELQRCGGASGTVFGRNGYPLAGATVSLDRVEAAGGDPIVRGGHSPPAVSDAHGTYTLTSLPTGRLQLHAAHADGSQKTVALALRAGEHAEHVDFVME